MGGDSYANNSMLNFLRAKRIAAEKTASDKTTMVNKSTPKKGRTNVQGPGKTSYANAVIGVGKPFF